MKFYFILTLFLSFLHADELLWVNAQIEAIAPNRVGLNKSDISTLKDPFIFLNKKSLLVLTKLEKTIQRKDISLEKKG